MPAKPVFVLQRIHKTTRAKEIVLAREPVRELQIKYPEWRWEQLRMFTLIQDARRLYPAAEALFKQLYTGHSPLAIAKISRAKRGVGNPNYWGIPAERKARIAASVKALDRRQIRNPFYGHHHSPEARKAISRAARKRRFKWAMEPGGKARRVPRNFELPVGWRWGHGNFRYRA